MGRRNGGQRTAPFRLPLYSPSQRKQLVGCEARWGYNRILKLEEPSSEKAQWGNDKHNELEQWDKRMVLPTSMEAAAAMKFAPPPGLGLSEVPVRVDLPNSNWVGYIDSVYDWIIVPGDKLITIDGRNVWKSSFHPDPMKRSRPAPLGSTGITVIHDWKFTSSWEYAMSSAELHQDFAANFYALEGFQGGARRVFARWVYTLFDGKTPKEVWTEISVRVMASLLVDGDREAQRANALRGRVARGEMRVEDFTINTDHCFDFYKTCPRKGVECNPVRSSKPKMTIRSQQDMEDFEKDVLANFGAPATKAALPPLPGQKSLPPLPGKPAGLPPLPGATRAPLPPLPGKALPPLPTKAAVSPATPESGFVNPEGGPTRAPMTPEEAAILQNIQPPAEEEQPEPDDLEGKSLDDLRAIAAAIGATHAPKAKTAGVTAAIRSRRAELELLQDDAMSEVRQDAPESVTEVVRTACANLSTEEVESELDAAIYAEEAGASGAEEARKALEDELAARDESERAQARFDAEVAQGVADMRAAAAKLEAEEGLEKATAQVMEPQIQKIKERTEKIKQERETVRAPAPVPSSVESLAASIASMPVGQFRQLARSLKTVGLVLTFDNEA